MNSGEFTEPRLLHSKGFIQLCTDKSKLDTTGSFLSTGSDADVWIWTGDELNEAEYNPKSIKGRTHCAIAWHGDDVYVGHTGTDPQTNIQKATVSRFQKDSMRLLAPIITFSLDVTTVDVSTSGKFLAAGAVDHVLKIVNLETGNLFRTEAGGQIMCVLFDPGDEYLAVTVTDGILRVFPTAIMNGQNSDPVCVRICSRILDLKPSSPRLQLCWSQSGENLFVPALGCVKVFNRNSFSEVSKVLSAVTAYEMFSICSVSTCGTFLASSTMEGSIYVWEIETGRLLTQNKYQMNGQPRVICSMFWHRALRETLFFADTEEHICSLSKCTKNIGDIEDDDSDFEQRKARNGSFAKLDDDENSQLSADLNAIKKTYGFDEEGNFCGFAGNGKSPHSAVITDFQSMYKPPVVPKAFVTASTPENLSKRYLKWNRYGVIINSSSGGESTIEINWHDSSVHPEIIIDNNVTNYCIADLTDEIVALASKAERDNPSELHVRCIKAWDHGSRKWDVTLPEHESVENIVIGKTFLVVATSQRYFRTFSYAGTQKIIFCYSGPLLTMCAFNDIFTAVTMNGGAYYEDEEPQFDMIANIFKMNTEGWYKCQSLVKSVPVNVSRNAKLDWIGYTERGTLCTVDSKYCCRMLSSNGIWIPIYNFTGLLKTKSDHIFPISFMDYPLCEIRYLYCRGTAYPLVESCLIPSIVKWQLPLCSQETEKTKYEEKLLLTEIRRCALNSDDTIDESESSEISTVYTTNVIHLFALACKTDRECRAAEFAAYAPNPKVIQSLCNYASKTRHPLLAEKVAEVGRRKSMQQSEEHLEYERKRNNPLDDKKENEFLAPKRLKKADLLPKRTSATAVVKVEEHQRGEIQDECMDELDSVAGSSLYSTLPPPIRQRPIANPFKRKLEDSFSTENDSFFDELASSCTSASHKTDSDSNQWKRMKTETSEFRQTLLPVRNSMEESKKPAGKKTGFELWLESVNDKLRKDYDGDEDNFLNHATKQFRRLETKEKQVVETYQLLYAQILSNKTNCSTNKANRI